MPKGSIAVPRMSDKDILSAMFEIAMAIGTESISIREFGSRKSIQLRANPPEISSDYLDDKVIRIQIINVRYHEFYVNFDRLVDDDSEDVFFDSLRIVQDAPNAHAGHTELDEQALHRVQEIVSRLAYRDEPHVAGLFKNPKLFRELLASHHKQTNQLQQMVLDVGKQVTEARSNLEAEYARRQSQLHEELDRLSKKRAAEHEAREKELAEREERLAQRQKDVDDRDNTHVRRELHKALKARIVERSGSLKVTPETSRKRLPIHVGSAFAILALGALITYHAFTLADLAPTATTAQTIILAAKPAALTLALLGLVAWYLRWMNRWFERYADAEFQLKQFELDIDRASWVVEAALEWKLEQDKPMPEHLLETISRNLFSKSEKDENADMHPADYLASAILGRASALNLKLPGGEISLTGRDIRKLQNEG